MVVILVVWCGVTLILNPQHSYKNNVYPIYLALLVTQPVVVFFLLLKKLGDIKVTKLLVLAGVYCMGILGYHALCNILIDELEIAAMVGTNVIPYIRLIVILLLVPIMISISNRFIPYTIGKKTK